MFSSLVNAQDKDNYFSASWGFDIKNGFVGSKPTGNEPALDWIGDLHFVSDDVDYNIGYESFDAIKFNRKYMSIGYHIYIGDVWSTNIKFSAQPALEWSIIQRGKMESDQDPNKTYSTPSLNINWNWDLNKYIAIQISTGLLPRPDTREIYHLQHNKYVFNNGLKTMIKIPW